MLTPVGELWTSPSSGNADAQQFRVETPSFDGDLTVTTKLQDQEFALPSASVYEGIAHAEGTLLGAEVAGDS